MEINPAHVMGDLLGIGTAFFFGLYFFAVRAARLQAGAARVTFGLSLVTAPILGAAALLNGDQFLPSDGKGVAALLAMALVSHAGGQGLLAIALGRLPTVFTSLVIFIEAIGAALIAWLVLGESLGWLQALGGVLILGGIWISRPRERKERAE
jgi:drug/metabolite transporter (DMT)-like permease